MNKKLISILGIITLLLTTSQGIQPQTNNFSIEDLTFKEIENLYVFFERSTYYLSEYLDNDVLVNLTKEVKGLYQLNEGLITSALKLKSDVNGNIKGPKSIMEFLKIIGLDSVGGKYQRTGIPSFINEVDPLLGSDLRMETLKSNYAIQVVSDMLIMEIVKKGRTQKFLSSLQNGSLKLIDYLPSNLKQSMEDDKKILQQEVIKKKTAIDGSYSRVLLILNKLKPILPSLLNSETAHNLFKENLIKSYIKVTAEAYLIEVVAAFIGDEQNRLLIEKLSANKAMAEEIFQSLENWNRYRKIPDPIRSLKKQADNVALKSVKSYRESFNSEYFELRKKVLLTSSMLLESTVQKLNDRLGNQISEQIKGSELATEAAKFIKSGSGNQGVNFFIDVKNDDQDKVWLRIKVSNADKENILREGKTENVEGEFFFVYQPKLAVPNGFKAPLKDFESSNNVLSKGADQLTEAVENLYIEIPLGFKANNMWFKKTEEQTSIKLVVFEDSRSTNYPLHIGIDDLGMWARFKKDVEKISAFEDRFQLSEALGISIKDIMFLPQKNTVDLVFTFNWQLPGVFGVLVAESFATEEKQINIKLSEIKDLGFKKDNIKRVLRNKITDEVVKILNAEKGNIMKHLIANLPVTRMSEIVFEGQESFVRGQFNVLPAGAEFLKIKSELLVQFDISYAGDMPSISTRIPNFASLNLKERIRDRIKETIQQIPAVQQSESFMANLMDGLNIKDITWNPLQEGICIDMGFKIGDMGKEVPLDICITKKDDIEDQIMRKFQVICETYAQELAKNYLNEMIADIDIDSIPDDINVFGLQFMVDKDSSTTNKIVASILLDNKSIEVEVRRKGTSYELTKFDASEIKEAIKKTFDETLNKLGFLKFSNPSFRSKMFTVDVAIDLRDYGINLIEHLGSLAIDINGKIHTDKLDLPQLDLDGFLHEIETALIAELSNAIQKYITEKIAENQDDFLVDFAGQEIQIKDLIIDIPSERFTVKADYLLSKGDILLPVSLEFSINPFMLVKIEVDGNVESLIQSGINAGANFLAGLVCGECLKIDLFQFDDQDWYKPVSITGTLSPKIPDLMAIPGIKFQLTKDGIDYDLKPRIPFPAPIPIGTTGFVLVYTYAEIDLEDKLFTLATSLTVGADVEAYETAELVRFDMSATINFNHLNRIDFTGDMVIVNMALIYGGGYVDIKKFEFEFYQKTPLFLKDVIDYNTLLQVSGKNKNAIGRGNLGLLGLTANLEVTAQIEDIYTNLKGRGSVDLPLSEFSGSLQTKFIPYVPLSYVLTSEARLSGAFSVWDFEITKAEINASIHRADIRFIFLDASLGASVPVLDALDEDLILDMIMGMFDFDPGMVVDFISKLDETKISLRNIDISFGTPEIYASDGFGLGNGSGGDDFEGGYEGDEGKNKMTSSAIIDNKLKGGLPTNHMPFKYQTSKVDLSILETHRNCKKFSFGFKVSWDCKNYTVKKEVFKLNNWPGIFNTLPSDFREYHAIYDNVLENEKTGNRMYDLYSPSVHDFIKGERQSNLLLRAPIELEQRKEKGTYYLCASKNSNQFCVPLKSQISQETINQIHFYGNLTYGSVNQPIKIWTSVGINPEDGVNYLRAPDSVTTKQTPDVFLKNDYFGSLTFSNTTFIPFNRESKFIPEKITLTGSPQIVYQVKTEPPSGKFFKKPLFNKQEAYKSYILNIDSNIQRINPDLKPLSLMEILLSQFVEYAPEEVLREDETSIVFKDSIAFINYAKDFITEPEFKFGTYLVVLEEGILAVNNDSKLELKQAKIDNDDPVTYLREVVYQLSNKILVEVPTIQQNFLVDILKTTYPSGGNDVPTLIKTMYSDGKKDKFPQVANPLMEYVQNWIAFNRSSEPIYVNKSQKDDFSFTAWDTSISSKNEDWSYSYVVTAENDDIEYFKIKLDSNDLTKSLGLIESDLSQHKKYFEHPSKNIYYRLIQTELANALNNEEELKQKVLLNATNKRIVYANMESNNAFSISVMSPGSLKPRHNEQIYLLNDNISGSRFKYPYQYRDHQDFFKNVLEEIIPDENYTACIKQINVNGFEIYAAVIFKDDNVDLMWEGININSNQDAFEIKKIENLANSKSYIIQNQIYLETRNRINSSNTYRSNEEKIADLILSGFEGFDIWAKYQSNTVNPTAVIRNLDNTSVR